MSVLATQRGRGRRRASDCDHGAAGSRPAAEAPPLFADVSGEPTLDELMSGVWKGLTAHATVSCPVCGGEMLVNDGTDVRPTEGRCRDCASTLS